MPNYVKHFTVCVSFTQTSAGCRTDLLEQLGVQHIAQVPFDMWMSTIKPRSLCILLMLGYKKEKIWGLQKGLISKIWHSIIHCSASPHPLPISTQTMFTHPEFALSPVVPVNNTDYIFSQPKWWAGVCPRASVCMVCRCALLQQHRCFSSCVCGCTVGDYVVKPWREWGLDAAINTPRLSLLSFGMWRCVSVCVSARMCVCVRKALTSSPGLLEGSVSIPSLNFNKAIL